MAQATEASKQHFVRREDTYDAWHFAEAVRVGDTIWVSGQRGFDAQDRISGNPDEQARVIFQNLGEVLQRAGATLDDIVDMTSYHVHMSDVDGFRAVKDEFIRPPYPAWTVVGVVALADPAMLVEVSVVAVVGSGRGVEVRR